MPSNPILAGAFVEFERKSLTDDVLSGFVLDCNDELTLFHYLADDFRLDGYCVIRNRDVTAWNVFDSPDYFKNRAIRLKKIRPRRPSGVQISNWQTAFETAGSKSPLLVLHREAMRNDVCNIGRHAGSTAQTVTLFEISPDAEWTKQSRFRLADITRLDFGGGYEDALWRVATETGLHREPPDQ